MRPLERRSLAGVLVVLAASLAPACITDDVPEDTYASQPHTRDAQAATSPGPAPEAGPSVAPLGDAGSAPPSNADGGSADGGTSSGACDLSGHWLISQRTIAQGLGVKQAGVWWFYYEIEQSGSDLTVKKGVVCGGEVYPVDLLAAAVEWRAAFPSIVQKNSHAGRRGTVAASGANCSVSFERSFTIVGATTPYYADAMTQLPTLEQRAAGSTPGWEDWDNDGQPAVSLNVSGIVTGTRYTVLRVWNDWKGTIAAGASSFKLGVPEWGQDEAILGATSDLLKQTGVPDADPKGHFAQFARLTPDQVQGDPVAVCANIRKLAPSLTAAANEQGL